jgi:hypothetical protein
MIIDTNVIRDNALKIEKGVVKYLSIMDSFRLCDVSSDYAFQRKYKGFYRVRRNDDFCQLYFEYMEKHKNDRNIRFENVISYLYKETGKMEASFSSKLLATINVNAPVWDSHVLSQLSIERPTQYQEKRLQAYIGTYSVLEKWYYDYLQTQNAKELISCFDTHIKNKQLTNVKKVDLVLWCMGPKGK